MPFNYCDPKQPTGVNNHLNNVTSDHRSWPQDRYDLTGGSFPVRPINKCECPGIRYNHKNYSGKYIQNQLMFRNPGVLFAIKNTAIVESLIHEPEIKFLSPKFTHIPCRSTSHLRVPLKYETALCKITENLKENYEHTRAFAIKKRENKLQALIDRKITIDYDDDDDVYNATHHRKHLGKKKKIQGILSRVSKNNIESDNDVTSHCMKGTLLRHVRKKVTRSIATSLENKKSKKKDNGFPTEAELRLEINEYEKNPHLFPLERYAYDPDGGMAMMCCKKKILAEYYESFSDEKMKHPSKFMAPEERLKTYKIPSKQKFHQHKFTQSILELISKAPIRSYKGPIVPTVAYNPYSHLGLIEESKKEELRKARYQLDDRNYDFNKSKALNNEIYGPIKSIPKGFTLDLVPPHLSEGMPATEIELEYAEAQILHKAKQANKLGRKTDAHSTGGFFLRFAKPLLSDSEIETEAIKVDKIKALDPEGSDIKDESEKFVEMLYSSKSLYPPTSTLQTTACGNALVINDFSRKSCKTNKTESHPKPLPPFPYSEKSDLDNEEEEEDLNNEVEEEESEYEKKKYLDANDSRESLPYSDVAFSDIVVPEITGVRKIPFYRTLAKAEAEVYSSSDSDEFRRSSEDQDVEGQEIEDQETDEQEIDEEQNESHHHLKEEEINEKNWFESKILGEESKELTNLREMFHHQMQNETIFETDPEWKKMLIVESVPPQITFDEQRADEHGIKNFIFWDAIFEHKMTKEIERRRNEQELKEQLNKLN